MSWNAAAALALLAGVVGYLTLPGDWRYLALAVAYVAVGVYYAFEGRATRSHR